MKVQFSKYQGTGNDFVLIDNRTNQFPTTDKSIIRNICDRRFGVGSDGLIKLEIDSSAQPVMKYYNADGNEGSMCGNGGRCFVKFAYDLGLFNDKFVFQAVDGLHHAELKNNSIDLEMVEVDEIESNQDFHYLNTGSPHYVKFVSNLSKYNVVEEGKKIRYSERFAAVGTNVNFIEREGTILNVRTYERGVEDETFSCGTGVTASAIIASMYGLESPVIIHTLGGDLKVSFDKMSESYKNIILSGPAEKVFDGEINIQ